MKGQLRAALVVLAFFTVLTGVVYPLAVTGLAQGIFPWQAGGSRVEVDGRAAGSALIGQPFSGARYFWSRPSATGPFPYNAGASSGSNLGPTNPVLLDRVKGAAEHVRAAHGGPAKGPVPVDLVTASASGLDPHISPAAAFYQVERVAAARGLDPAAVRRLVEAHLEPRTFGVLGEPRINVLLLNLDLDRDLDREIGGK